MNIYKRIKRFFRNGDEPITDGWAIVDTPQPIDEYRCYKMALVYTNVRTIVTIVVDSEEDAVKLEQDENFIKWITGWIEVKL